MGWSRRNSTERRALVCGTNCGASRGLVSSAGMRATMNVSLPPDLKRWVDEEVKSGGYGTASEYLRDVLRRARERKFRRQLDAMLVEAVEDGANVVMDRADWASIRKSARAAAAKASKGRRR